MQINEYQHTQKQWKFPLDIQRTSGISSVEEQINLI